MSKNDIARCKIEANKSARTIVTAGIITIAILVIVEILTVPDQFMLITVIATIGALVVIIFIVLAIMHDSCNELK